MNNWKTYYTEHKVSLEEAVYKIPSDSTMVTSHGGAEPKMLLAEMVKHKEHFKGASLFSIILLGETPYCNPEVDGHIRYQTFFVSGAGCRKAVAENRADFIPCFYHKVPSLVKNHIKPNVAILSLSKPDEHGWCRFGLSTDFQRAGAESADLVIAQINEKMPIVLGDTAIHVTDLDYIVEVSQDLPELSTPVIGDVEKAIGEYCAKLVNDGDTLQLGIGGIPDAVLLSLKDKKDLGIHSEMFSDGVVDLIEAGVITNRKKNFHPNVSIATFLIGSKKLYDYVDNNPAVELYPVDYTNDPYIAAKNDNLIAINSCIQVDLTGQVSAEAIGTRQFSGVGGQVDFVRAASMSKGGRAIIAIPSTASKGKLSRIVPVLDLGAAVSTSRMDVDYIVTEYGVAHLTGKSINARAEALISISHPDFRDMLREEYAKRFSTVK